MVRARSLTVSFALTPALSHEKAFDHTDSCAGRGGLGSALRCQDGGSSAAPSPCQGVAFVEEGRPWDWVVVALR